MLPETDSSTATNFSFAKLQTNRGLRQMEPPQRRILMTCNDFVAPNSVLVDGRVKACEPFFVSVYISLVFVADIKCGMLWSSWLKIWFMFNVKTFTNERKKYYYWQDIAVLWKQKNSK